MGKYIVENLMKSLIKADVPVKNAKVTILGFTFKENCPDTRNTRVIDIVRELQEFGIDPVIVDPVADPAEASREYGIRFAEADSIRNMDAVVLSVAHDEFKNLCRADLGKLFKSTNSKKVLLDIKGILNKSEYEKAGYIYWRL
jgi:UDP-N-acetyl-D-galactosamine dehydrogenase